MVETAYVNTINTGVIMNLSIAKFLAVTIVLFAINSIGAITNVRETWSNNSDEGWNGIDPLNRRTLSLSTATGSLGINFRQLSMSFPEVGIIKAENPASSGAFVGDFFWAAATHVSFKFYCGTRVPANLRLCFESSSGNRWYNTLGQPNANGWTEYTIPMELAQGWQLPGSTSPALFHNDMRDIAWIGVQIQRSSYTDAESYQVDDFSLIGPSSKSDTDGDSASDWAEYIAGTDANNGGSNLALSCNRSNPNQGITLAWDSVSLRSYNIERTQSLTEPFEHIASRVEATPPSNQFKDETATGTGPFFYRITVAQ